MQEFSNIADDFSDKSFENCSLGAGLLENVLPESEVKRINDAWNEGDYARFHGGYSPFLNFDRNDEIKEIFSRLLSFRRDPSVKFIDEVAQKLFLQKVPNMYLCSESYEKGETIPPFTLLENYVQELAKDENVLPRVDRSELFERECFMVDFSKYLFEAQPNIGAVCFFGSFARGKKNPHDIDVVIYLKNAFPTGLEYDPSYRWDWLKSNAARHFRGIYGWKPLPGCEQHIIDTDNALFAVEEYQNKGNPNFVKIVNNNTFGEGDRARFKINAIVMPYQFDFNPILIQGGNIWVINSKGKENYQAFFSRGQEFSGSKLLHPEILFEP